VPYPQRSSEITTALLRDISPEQLTSLTHHIEDLGCQLGYVWDGTFLMRVHEELAVVGEWRAYLVGEELCPVCLVMEFQSDTVSGHSGLRRVFAYADETIASLLTEIAKRLTRSLRTTSIWRLG
jgi:hypothetical protein